MTVEGDKLNDAGGEKQAGRGTFGKLVEEVVVPKLVENGYSVYRNEDSDFDISDENGRPLE